MLVSVLAWGLVTIGGALVFSVVWFARRIVAQLDRLETLFTDTTHAMDLRIHALEWAAQDRRTEPRNGVRP